MALTILDKIKYVISPVFDISYTSISVGSEGVFIEKLQEFIV